MAQGGLQSSGPRASGPRALRPRAPGAGAPRHWALGGRREAGAARTQRRQRGPCGAGRTGRRGARRAGRRHAPRARRRPSRRRGRQHRLRRRPAQQLPEGARRPIARNHTDSAKHRAEERSWALKLEAHMRTECATLVATGRDLENITVAPTATDTDPHARRDPEERGRRGRRTVRSHASLRGGRSLQVAGLCESSPLFRGSGRPLCNVSDVVVAVGEAVGAAARGPVRGAVGAAVKRGRRRRGGGGRREDEETKDAGRRGTMKEG